MLCPVTGIRKLLLTVFEEFAVERFLSSVTPVVDLEVLQSCKAPATSWLFASERSLTSVHPQMCHQLVFGIERFVLAATVLNTKYFKAELKQQTVNNFFFQLQA